MGIFTFIWNCIFNFIELLDNVPIINSFSALDFILCTLLLGYLVHRLMKGGSE